MNVIKKLRAFQSGSNSITPQGDGNASTCLPLVELLGFKFHYPARGRKH